MHTFEQMLKKGIQGLDKMVDLKQTYPCILEDVLQNSVGIFIG